MNHQGDKGIEWTHAFGPRTGYTWNVVKGCQHECRWEMPDGKIAKCYAESVAEGVARAAYPNGFDHHYFEPDKLEEPLKLKTPAGIFLDSMSDLMGTWVPEAEIMQVLDVVSRADQHIFMLLTKNAPRLLKFKDLFPANLWVGVSMPPTFFRGNRLTAQQQEKMFVRALEVLRQIHVPVRWISFEPLSFDVSLMLDDLSCPIEWAVIGAASNGKTHYQPDSKHVFNLLYTLDRFNVPTFFKGNLEWPTWRSDFPGKVDPITQTAVDLPSTQLALF